jgi:hypothetical protein
VLNVLSLASVKQEVDDQLPSAVELPGVSGNGSPAHRATR